MLCDGSIAAVDIDASSERRDRLAYLADLTLELKCLADAEGCPTLAGLLALAHAEALRQSER